MESATTAAKNAMAITYGSGSNTLIPDIVGIPLRRTLATADPPRAPKTNPMTMGRLIGARILLLSHYRGRECQRREKRSYRKRFTFHLIPREFIRMVFDDDSRGHPKYSIDLTEHRGAYRVPESSASIVAALQRFQRGAQWQ